MKNNTPEVGQLAYPGAERDAIHMAIAPVVAGTSLAPGERVIIKDNKAFGSKKLPIGIVDPFLTKAVKEGEIFWLFMFPNTITSLRHDWEHPKLPKNVDKNYEVKESEDWLIQWAEDESMTYTQLLQGLKEFAETGAEYYINNDLSYSRFGESKDLWKHYGIVVGKVFNLETVPFRCAC